MPDRYTYVHTAMQALMRSGHTVACQPAFAAGANGPDVFFLYQPFRKLRKPNLPALAARIHREDTGEFLLSLVRYASTAAQQSFVLGFVTHYTTDCTLNPYIAAMSQKGAPYGDENGMFKMAAALDSALYYEDYRTRLVPLHAGSPVLITDDLAQVAVLLRECIGEVYGKSIPLIALADAYHHNLSARRLMISRTGIKRPLLAALQKTPPHRDFGPLAARMQPAKPLRRLPSEWKNPYSGEEMDLTTSEVLALAEQTGAVCITAAMRYWLGELEEDRLVSVLGNNDYFTGMPCKSVEEKPAGGASS